METTVQRLKTIGLFLIITAGLYGQNELSEPWEKGLNERQPPEYVFKTIGVRPGMTVGEIGTDPDSLNAKNIMQNFDVMYDQMRSQN